MTNLMIQRYMEVSGQHHASAALTPTPLERTARYPLHRRLAKLQSQFGRTGEEENLIRIKKIEKKKEGKTEQKESPQNHYSIPSISF